MGAWVGGCPFHPAPPPHSPCAHCAHGFPTVDLPRTLRVNLLRATVPEVLEELEALGLYTTVQASAADG